MTPAQARTALAALDGVDAPADFLARLRAIAGSDEPIDAQFTISASPPDRTAIVPTATPIIEVQRSGTAIVRYADALPAVITQPQYEFEPMQWSPQLEALGYTEDDVRRVNMEREINTARQKRQAERKPNLNPADYLDADFAPPDYDPRWGWYETQPGSKNRFGDRCVRVEIRGTRACPVRISIYECVRSHGYETNPNVPGCPKCWEAGVNASATDYNPTPDDDDDRDPNVEPF